MKVAKITQIRPTPFGKALVALSTQRFRAHPLGNKGFGLGVTSQQ
jgi:hypothetical protein